MKYNVFTNSAENLKLMSKKIILLLTLSFSLLNFVNAQTPPNAFNYSAVARNAAGQPIASTTIGIQITILKTSPTGVSQYSENHFVNTDAFGLFNLVIGAGALQSGSITTIDWSNDNYYLKVGMDAAGGTNFLTMGTTQLLSVPYAMYAKSAGTVSGGVNETDPVFGTSVAGGISAADTASWNNHFSGDYNDLTNTPTLATVATSGSYNDLLNKPITVTSISANGDTLYLSNGQTFIANNSTGNLVLPSITTNVVTGITSNSATFGGSISNANGNQIMERGIVFSTSPNPTVNYGNNKIIMGNGIGTFDTISALVSNYPHLLSPNTTYYVRAYAKTENTLLVYGNQVSFTTLSVGQTGPGGGIIFFNKGNTTGGWQYLEAAPNDFSTVEQWGCNGTSIPGTQLIVGSGEANTTLIMVDCNEASFASKLCDNLSLGGQTDWFLPSIDDFCLMFKNLFLNGNFNTSSSYYWSSSEFDGGLAYAFMFDAGGFSNNVSKEGTYLVRAIRAF
jgi:hypothetical protein